MTEENPQCPVCTVRAEGDTPDVLKDDEYLCRNNCPVGVFKDGDDFSAGRPLDMDEIGKLAESRLTSASMLSGVRGPESRRGFIHTGSLQDELDVIERTAKEAYDDGRINVSYRNAILCVVAGLRQSINDMEEWERWDNTPGT